MKSVTELFADMVPEMMGIMGGSTNVRWGDKSLNGVFNNDYEEVEQFGQIVSANRVTCLVETAKIDGMAHNDKVTIDGTDYRVADIQENSGGTTLLVLRETS